jgi:hypothetical protein
VYSTPSTQFEDAASAREHDARRRLRELLELGPHGRLVVLARQRVRDGLLEVRAVLLRLLEDRDARLRALDERLLRR